MNVVSIVSSARQLAALEEDLNTFWLVRYFPHPDATTEGVRQRAKRSGQRAMAIHAVALVEGDAATANAAKDIAKRLVPFLSIEGINEAYRKPRKDVASNPTSSG